MGKLTHVARLAFLLCLLAAPQSWGATKWVDITGTGTGAANGADVDNLCAGTADADCAVSAGDTQVWCGTSGALASITVPTAGASNNHITYDLRCSGGTPADWTSSGGAANAGILLNKDWTILRGGRVTNPGGRALQLNCSNCRVVEGAFFGSQDNIFITTPQSKSNIYIGYVRSYGATRYGLTANTNSTSANSIVDVTLEYNDISDNTNTNAYFKCDIAASNCNFKRWTVQFNSFNRSATNVGFVLQDCYKVGAVDCGDIQTNTGADFEDMIICDNEANDNAVGGFAIYGVVPSTGTWGKNKICRNTADRNAGVIGGFDWFNSTYFEVFDNSASDNSTATIDGNAFLNDYGNNHIRIYRNKCFRNAGLSGVKNSGACLMILRGENVEAWDMIGSGNRLALYFSGGSFTESGIDIKHFTVVGNTEVGAYFDASQAANSTTIQNSALAGDGTGIHVEAAGGINVEDYNVIAFDTRSAFNGVGWVDGEHTTTRAPRLVGGEAPTTVAGFAPSATSPMPGAGADLGDLSDFHGDPFHAVRDIGAIRRDQCYRRGPSGALDMARRIQTVQERCRGVPARYPEGL